MAGAQKREIGQLMKGNPQSHFVENLTSQELVGEFLAAATSRELRAVLVHGFPGSGKTENIEHFLQRKLRDEQFAAKCSIEPVESAEIVRGDCGATLQPEEEAFLGFEQVTRELDEKARLRRRSLKILNVLVELVGVDVDKVLGLLEESPEHMGRFQLGVARTLEKLRGRGTGADAHVARLVGKQKKGRPLIVYIDNVQNMGRDGLQLVQQLIAEQPEGTWGIIVLEFHAESHSQPQPILWQLLKDKAISSVFTRRLNPAQLRLLVKGTLGENLLSTEELDQLVSVLGGNPGTFSRLVSQWEAMELIERTPSGWCRSQKLGMQALKPPEVQYLDEFLPKFAGDGRIDEGERGILAAYARTLLLDETRTAEMEELGKFIASHPQYEIVKYVRRGTLGSVYEGRDTSSGKAVLIEVERRIEIGRRPKSEVSIPAIDSVRGEQTPFLAVITVDDRSAGRTVVVTEFAGGYTLTELTAYFALSSYSVCFEAAEKLLIRLRSLHDRSKCHGRLRPEGVLYNPDNGAMALVDFVGGCAESKAPQDLHSFLSPEQLGSPSNAYLQSDVFAVGVILYQLLLGQQPWGVSSGEALKGAIIAHALQQSPARPLDKGVFKVLGKATQKDHYDRYDSAGAMLEDVRKVAQRLPVWKPPRRKPVSSRKSRPWVYAIPVAILIVSLIWFFGLGPTLEDLVPLGHGPVPSAKGVANGPDGSQGPTRDVRKVTLLPDVHVPDAPGGSENDGRTEPNATLDAGTAVTADAKRGKAWFLVTPFHYDDRALKMVPPNSFEYLLKFKLMAGVDNLVVIDQVHFDAFLESHGGSHVVPEYRLEGKVSEKILAATATLTLELKLTTGKGSFSKSFDLEKSYLLKAHGASQDQHGGELVQVFSWLVEHAPALHRTDLYKVPLGLVLTSQWEAFEHYFNAEEAWSALNVGVARSEYGDALNYDKEFLLARLGRAEVFSFDGSRDRASTDLVEIDKVLGRAERGDGLKRTLPPDKRQEFAALKQKLINLDIAGEEAIRKELANKFRFLPKTHYDLAEVYFHSGRCGDAIEEYSKALDYSSSFSKALNHRAYCHAYRGDFSKALNDLHNYLQPLAEKDRANAYDSLGDIHIFKGDYVKALGYKDKASRLGGEDYMLLAQAKVLILMGRVTEAKAICERLRHKVGTTGVRATNYLAYFAYLDGNFDRALDLIGEVTDRFPRPDDSALDESAADQVLAPFRSGAKVVYRYSFFHDYWVLPLWIDGLIAYQNEDVGRLLEICRFLFWDVRVRYGLRGEGLYRPVTKFHHHLRRLRIGLEKAQVGGSRQGPSIGTSDAYAAKLDYWTSMFGRAYFYTEYANLAFAAGNLPETEQLLGMVPGDKGDETTAYNGNYVPALVLQARLKNRNGDVEGARSLLILARQKLASWQSEEDSYQYRMTVSAETELFPGSEPAVSIAR